MYDVEEETIVNVRTGVGQPKLLIPELGWDSQNSPDQDPHIQSHLKLGIVPISDQLSYSLYNLWGICYKLVPKRSELLINKESWRSGETQWQRLARVHKALGSLSTTKKKFKNK